MKSQNNERITENVVIRPLLVGLTGSTSGYQDGRLYWKECWRLSEVVDVAVVDVVGVVDVIVEK